MEPGRSRHGGPIGDAPQRAMAVRHRSDEETGRSAPRPRSAIVASAATTSRTSIMPTPYARCVQWKTKRQAVGAARLRAPRAHARERRRQRPAARATRLRTARRLDAVDRAHPLREADVVGAVVARALPRHRRQRRRAARCRPRARATGRAHARPANPPSGAASAATGRWRRAQSARCRARPRPDTARRTRCQSDDRPIASRGGRSSVPSADDGARRIAIDDDELVPRDRAGALRAQRAGARSSPRSTRRPRRRCVRYRCWRTTSVARAQQRMWRPPSTRIDLARDVLAPRAGRRPPARRPRACRAAQRRRASGGARPLPRSSPRAAARRPGATAFTRTPGASARASARVICTTPAFVIPCGTYAGHVSNAARSAMLTIGPAATRRAPARRAATGRTARAR